MASETHDNESKRSSTNDESSDWVSYISSSSASLSRPQTASRKPWPALTSMLSTSERVKWRQRRSLHAFDSLGAGNGALNTTPYAASLSQTPRELCSQLSTTTFPSTDGKKTTVSLIDRALVTRDNDCCHTKRAIYRLPSPTTVTATYAWPLIMDPTNMIPSSNITDIVTNLSRKDDASRKMAVFKLQSLINDPAFAEHFVMQGGLPKLRTLILQTNGNTLAYGLASFARLLDVDQGWDAVDDEVVQKVSTDLRRGPLRVLMGDARSSNWLYANH